MDKVWYNGEMIYDEYYLGDHNISVFQDKYKNRLLEPYAETLYNYYHKDLLTRYQISTVKSIKSRIISRLKNCYGLALMLRDLKHGDVRWQGFDYHNPSVAFGMFYNVEQLFYDELEEPWVKMMRLRDDGTTTLAKQLWDKWANTLAILPQKDTIAKDDDGDITEDGINDAISDIKYCLDHAEEYVVYTEGNIADEIIKKAHELGLKMCNASYRELYECLEFFDLIPRDQVTLHKKTTSRYARENYIKAKVNRLGLV